jgi:site-specific DNA-methyltransferase (adenine-specific)
MKPDYQIKNISLYNCDCMEFMKDIPDNFYDLAIVDPPYGIDWMKQIENPNTKANWKVHDKKDWDKNIPQQEYFDELFRVSENQIVWGGNYMTEYLPPSPCWLIWDKMQEFTGAVFEMAWTSFKSPAKAFRMSRVEAYANKNKIHPTQKPKELYKWCLSKYAKSGDKIFDSHGGSFSSACACLDMGFEFDGCEIDQEYFQNAVERLKNNVQEYFEF